jgi:hypothetical protein
MLDKEREIAVLQSLLGGTKPPVHARERKGPSPSGFSQSMPSTPLSNSWAGQALAQALPPLPPPPPPSSQERC